MAGITKCEGRSLHDITWETCDRVFKMASWVAGIGALKAYAKVSAGFAIVTMTNILMALWVAALLASVIKANNFIFLVAYHGVSQENARRIKKTLALVVSIVIVGAFSFLAITASTEFFVAAMAIPR